MQKISKTTLVLLVLLVGYAIFKGGLWRSVLENPAPLAPSPTPHLGQFDPVDYRPEELNKILTERDDVIVLDVRSKEEYDKGHLRGAAHANYYDADQLAQVVGDKTPVTYCTFSTWRAPYAAYELYKQGYTNVGVLTGGITAWQQEFDNLTTTEGATGIVAEKPKAPFPRQEAFEAEGKGIVEIDMTARAFEFVPSKIEVQMGQRVVLNITSVDVEHGFALPEFAVNEKIPAGKTRVVEFIANRRGTFPFVCSVYCGANHTSMVGEVVVQ